MNLTKEQILNMSHEELNIAIAEHVFKAKVIGKEGHPDEFLLVGFMPHMMPMSGQRWQNAVWRNSEEKAWLDIPKYASDIATAWKIIERLREADNGAFIDIYPGFEEYQIIARNAKDHYVVSKSAAEGICKAALLAIGGDQE